MAITRLPLTKLFIVDKYPIPNINDLFTKLTGGVMYTTLKIDLSHAHQQVVLDEESRKLTTINTSKRRDCPNMNGCHTELVHLQAYSKESWNNCYKTSR